MGQTTPPPPQVVVVRQGHSGCFWFLIFLLIAVVIVGIVVFLSVMGILGALFGWVDNIAGQHGGAWPPFKGIEGPRSLAAGVR